MNVMVAGSHEIVSSCLWEVGHAHTDPSKLLPKQDLDLFDVAASKATLALAAALDKTCDASCEVRLLVLPPMHADILGTAQPTLNNLQ